MASSMQDYLKRYNATTTTRIDDEIRAKPKKKRKVKGASTKLLGNGVVIVDDDGFWQQEGKPEEEDEDEGDKPTVMEEVDVKVMQKIETLKAHRPYISLANDGSGWVTVKGDAEEARDGAFGNLERSKRGDSRDRFSPRERHDSPDISSPRRNDRAHSPPRETGTSENEDADDVKFTPRRRHDPRDSSPPRRNDRDLSPPRKRGTTENGDAHDARSPPRRRHDALDLSPPRRKYRDLSPPRRRVSNENDDGDARYPPKRRHDSLDLSLPRRNDRDLSPPRRVSNENEDGDARSSPRRRHDSLDLSPPRRNARDLSPPRKRLTSENAYGHDDKRTKTHKMADGSVGGLRTDKQVTEEIKRKKVMEVKALADLDPSQSGRGAETVYRDKRGRRLEGLEELIRQQKGEAKPAEKPLEWGKGLAQKREMEAKFAELEAEKNKPFARSRDDPDLDKELKEAVRWGDPMAHLVKKKMPDQVLPDLGASEEMKASGFIVPQDIPSHSWLKRGIAPPANRYGIKPGRHWDGVDRSTGYERKMFMAKNEKQALEREAYLWSVSDM